MLYEENENFDKTNEIQKEKELNLSINNSKINSTNSSIQASNEKSSEFEVSMNIFKGFTGLGVVTLAYGIKEAGIINGILLTMICSYGTYHCMMLCLEIANDIDHKKIEKLSELLNIVLGKNSKFIGDVFVSILQIGTCISYVFCFSLFFNYAFCYGNVIYLCGNHSMSFLVALTIIIPLSLVKTLTRYNKFSIVANIFIVITLITLFCYSLQVIFQKGISGTSLFTVIFLKKYFSKFYNEFFLSLKFH